MDQEALVAQLNDLLNLEFGGLLGRLDQLHPFVEWADAVAIPVFRRIVADEGLARRRLTEAIEAEGGVPRPPRPDLSSARVHYLDVRYLLPLLIDEQRRRVAAYEAVAGRIPSDRPSAPIVSALLAQHRAHLEQLETLAQRLGPAAPEPVGAPAQDHDA